MCVRPYPYIVCSRSFFTVFFLSLFSFQRRQWVWTTLLLVGINRRKSQKYCLYSENTDFMYKSTTMTSVTEDCNRNNSETYNKNTHSKMVDRGVQTKTAKLYMIAAAVHSCTSFLHKCIYVLNLFICL